RQQPCKARLCSFKEKVDRRPIDPPPIIQLLSNNQVDDDYLQNPYFFLYATLTDAHGETDLHFVNGNRTTAGTVVQSLHRLKDFDNTDGGFFIFSDISVRLEGFYRLKFTLYEIEGSYVNRICSIVSDMFQVYSPKSFPGMSESTFLTRSFSDQGVRIRIRKEPRSSNSNPSGKRRKKTEDHTMESDDEGHYLYEHRSSPTNMILQPVQPSKVPNQHPIPSLQPLSQQHSSQPFAQLSSPSLPYQSRQFIQPPSPKSHDATCPEISKPTLPSPKEILRSSPMSMQHILSNTDEDISLKHRSFLSSTTDHQQSKLFSTRVLPLPLPSQSHSVSTPSHMSTSQIHPEHSSLPNSAWRGNLLPPPSALSSSSSPQPTSLFQPPSSSHSPFMKNSRNCSM
ncbi:hypothetical protein A0J61_04504, partial [Choanephora cucurbitarum]